MTHVALPPLPKPAMDELNPYRGLVLNDERPWLHWYDADQMRAYGAACAAAERERCVQIIEAHRASVGNSAAGETAMK